MERVITIGGSKIRMRASALVPRLYRFKFGRDLISDMRQLQKAYAKAVSLPENASEEEKQDAQLSALDLTLFENVAYIMAKHANKNIPDDPDEWLASIPGVFPIYEVLPVIIDMWRANGATTSKPKKK